MTPEIFIKRTLGASAVKRESVIQSLWSGYGEIVRFSIEGSSLADSVILKSIQLNEIQNHPRGWNSDLSHQRKLHSYQVEKNWYQDWSAKCDDSHRVAKLFGVLEQPEYLYLLLEDLDSSGYSSRCSSLTVQQSLLVLNWLAAFHAHFLCSDRVSKWPEGLWQRGTYWHLDTRPNEWQSMEEGRLKESASEIDKILNNAKYQTLVHGDAKLANFCFSDDISAVAAVDFQYVGRGIGVQDVAYFLGSCFSEQELQTHLEYLLESYLAELSRCLVSMGESPDIAEAVAQEWGDLFPIAWADFHRFIMGWSPTHHKNTPFSQNITNAVLEELRRP
ncbi:DUF1679 domain-containing protein [Marinomonas sp. C2222]|uniref:DUF1679 domain-containing protein n=1 Tax=Marinomonas sargassi TaxID=2984494 RepID=A0ABT2YW84_9GAMM|nr:phosphotransferase [Marinomonas sargassi]MCV2404118.1 DUF1679 domain-containing protein [Marinomonas sargassi]